MHHQQAERGNHIRLATTPQLRIPITHHWTHHHGQLHDHYADRPSGDTRFRSFTQEFLIIKVEEQLQNRLEEQIYGPILR